MFADMIVIVESIVTVVEQRYDLYSWYMLLVYGGSRICNQIYLIPRAVTWTLLLSLNERHITVLFSKRFTLAASINAMTGYLTRCSVHWFFGGKSATTSKMSGSNISISSSELAVSMFSKSEMSTLLWLRRLNSPAVGISKHSRVNCYR